MASAGEFKARYAELNAEQKKAVDAIEGPVMVIAGPGTGKTSILTLRIARILEKTDTPPSAILALTFTESGVRAMRQGLFRIIGDRAYKVHIRTFHGFAAWVIETFGDHFVHYRGRTQMTEIDAEAMMRSILEDPGFRDLRPLGDPDYYVEPVLRAVSAMKKEAVTPQQIRDFAAAEAKRIEGSADSLSTRGATKGRLKAEARQFLERCRRTLIFADAYDAYERKKRAEKRNDYDDLLIELLAALKNDELLLRLLQEQFLYILVDEHQDTNDAQNLLLNMLAAFFETPNLFIVGDEKQAIYRFQGASVENFMRLRKLYAGMTVIELSKNYRSHQGILDASIAMARHNYGAADAELFPRALTAGKLLPKRLIEVVSGEREEDAEQHLVGRLAEIVAAEPGATAAVITRTNREAARVYELIERAGLSAAAEKDIDALSHPLGALFIALLRAVNDPADLAHLAKTAAGGLWNLSFGEAAELVRELKSGRAAAAAKRLPALERLRGMLSRAGAVDFFILLSEESGFLARAFATREGAEVWRGIIALCDFAAHEAGRTDAVSVSERIFLYADSKKKIPVRIAAGRDDAAIRVLTAHASKGLEFDYVFVPYAVEESWLGRRRGTPFVLPKTAAPAEDERDARRLFFVALTRARKHAVVLTSGEGAGGEGLSPLRFIAELGETKRVRARAAAAAPAEGGFARRTRRNREEEIAYAKKVLTGEGLSVTALNHFLKCPNEFFFLSILKLPEAPSASSEKGNAMHLALARVWQKRAKTAEDIEQVIARSVAEYAEGSLLPENEWRAVRDKLLADAPAAAKALAPHFALAGETLIESWSERMFRHAWKGEAIEVPLHGKIDAIVSDGGTARVFDYKTRRAMSENAVKGLTKKDDGGYWRQLVFYKFLLADDPRCGGKDILPALVFVSPDPAGHCPTLSLPITGKDVAALTADIARLIDAVWSGELFSRECGDPECRFCALRRSAAF